MDKRTFLKTLGLLGASTPFLSLLQSCGGPQPSEQTDNTNQTAEFTLPELAYPASALAPHIDEETMNLHHGKHHAGYVKKLNEALADSPHKGKTLEQLLADLKPEETALRNNGGGHFNHSLYWKILSPKPAEAQPTGKLLEAINASFGSYEKLVEALSKAALGRFGSGWAWLVQGADGKLFVSSTPNQDNPMMAGIVAETGKPLLGIDVWEHAYYLNYQNKRAAYVEAFFKVLDWKVVASFLA